MRKTLFTSLFVLLLGINCLIIAGQSKDNPASGDKFVGTWTGTWTGGSSGKFDLTVTKDTTGKLSATVTSTNEQGDGGTFRSKSVEVTGDKVKIKLEDTNGEVEVSLDATLEGKTLKGSYTVRSKADGAEAETGTITASKK